MKPIRSIIIEGVDRLGKDTLISGLLDRLGYMQVVHYQKPLLLDKYIKEARRTYIQDEEIKLAALKAYQKASFENMFHLLASNAHLILNRAHLGEVVYSPRYRGYDGSYVYSLEKQHADILDEALLVLLHASDFSFIADDGESFNFEKKEEEQLDFVRAFERSAYKHKLMLDVSVNGGFVPAHMICNGVVQAFNTIQSMDATVWQMSWIPDGNGGLTQVNELFPDPRRIVSA